MKSQKLNSLMDPGHEEMRSLGLSIAILIESFETIFSCKKIFSQIVLVFILPLTICYLADIELSYRLFFKTDRFIFHSFVCPFLRLPDLPMPIEWLYCLLFKTAYLTFLTVFASFSTATVVYTITAFYTGRDVFFQQVVKMVPTIWKRLFLTLLSMFLTFIFYNALAVGFLLVSATIFGISYFGIFLWLMILSLYSLGFVYLSLVWQLAAVVSILESAYGVKAMMKGKDLIKGKRMEAMFVFFLLYELLVSFVSVYMLFVQHGHCGLATVWRVVIGFSCMLLLLSLFLVFMVSQTVLYLVCKSHHRETIDKLSLSANFHAYLAESKAGLK